jgi:hypothetical protein
MLRYRPIRYKIILTFWILQDYRIWITVIRSRSCYLTLICLICLDFFYLDRKEYSYVPRYNLSQNKSRLDFFLVSDSLLDFTSDCLIHTALQNKLFDHKAVSLFFNKTRKKLPERYAISKKELNNDLLVFLVHATVAETYIQHWVGDRR